MKRSYELVAIFDPELKVEEKEKLLQKIKKEIDKEGKALEEKDWGRKELAYPIKKQRMGFFYWLSFEAEPKVPAALDKKMKLEEKILRFLLVTVN